MFQDFFGDGEKIEVDLVKFRY